MVLTYMQVLDKQISCGNSIGTANGPGICLTIPSLVARNTISCNCEKSYSESQYLSWTILSAHRYILLEPRGNVDKIKRSLSLYHLDKESLC